MTDQQFETLLRVIRGEILKPMPVGFIIDSPWLPGWYGCTTLDYYTNDGVWLDANRRAIETFPDAMFLPGFWSELGMCTEPSAFGAKCIWQERNLPHADKIIADIEKPIELSKPDPRTDGLAPFMLNRLKLNQDAVRRMGHEYRFAVARGPLNIATFLAGTTEFMMGLKIAEENCVGLVNLITDFLIDWIGLQLKSFPSMDGILILDDLIGFLGREDFEKYALPPLKKIYDSFNVRVKFLHNDAAGLITAEYLQRIGVNLFNFSHNHSLQEMQRLTGGKVCLLGNIPPRDVLAGGTPDQIETAVKCAVAPLQDRSRILLSVGGGVPQGVTTEQMNAFIRAAREI